MQQPWETYRKRQVQKATKANKSRIMLFTAALPFPARACGTNWSWIHGTDHTLSGQTLPNLPGLSGNRQDQFLLRAVSSAELESRKSIILCACSPLLFSLGHLHPPFLTYFFSHGYLFSRVHLGQKALSDRQFSVLRCES